MQTEKSGKMPMQTEKSPIYLIILTILKNDFPLRIHHFSKYFSKLTKQDFDNCFYVCVISIFKLGKFNIVTLNVLKQIIWRFQSIEQRQSLRSNIINGLYDKQ